MLCSGAIKPTATIYCVSKMYPGKNQTIEMETAATVCDGVEECEDGEDEGGKCNNNNIIFWGVFGSLALISVIAFLIRYWNREPGSGRSHKFGEDVHLPDEWRELGRLLDRDTFVEQHNSKDFQGKINLLILTNKYLKTEETRIEQSKLFYKRELNYHGGNLAEARNSMRSYLEPAVVKIVIGDVEPGITRRFCPGLERLLEKLDQKSWAYWMFRRIRIVFTTNLDFLKDVFLMIVILFAIGGPLALRNFPFSLTSITVFFLLATIFIPLFISSVLLARDKVRDLDTSVSISQKVKIYVTTILLSFINPLLLINDIEVNKDKILYHLTNPAHTVAVDKQQGHSTVIRLLRERSKLERRHFSFTRVDLGFETIYQTVFQIVLLLLASTDTGTTVGLKEMFKKADTIIPIIGVSISGNVILGFSIAFSLNTCFNLHVKSVKVSKGFLLIKPYLTVFLWAMVSVVKRIMIMVIFFTPSLGLFNILHHWILEQTPFVFGKLAKEGKLKAIDEMLYVYNKTPVPWSDIDRWDYTDPEDPTPPPYTLYTGLDPGLAFGLFWVLLLLNAITVFVIKVITVEKFYKFNILDIVLHCLENCHIPLPWRDWDEGAGSVEEVRARYRRVRTEVVLTMLVNLLFNMVMLVPMIYTGDTHSYNFPVYQEF